MKFSIQINEAGAPFRFKWVPVRQVLDQFTGQFAENRSLVQKWTNEQIMDRKLEKILAPTGAQGVTLSVRPGQSSHSSYFWLIQESEDLN